ncbi:MAG: Crp/Fnr family transcriptional regulator [Gammaproteobacteria bacterium]
MIGNIPLFSSLTVEELGTIERHSSTRSFRKNTVIVHKGDRTDSLFVIQSGKVKVYNDDEQGKEIILNILTAGDFFGELALLGETPRTATVLTLEESVFTIISRAEFLEWMKRCPDITLKIINGLVARVRALTENVTSLALKDVYGRVTNSLLEHATEMDGKLVTEKLTQQDIADRVGASREMVSRILNDLKKGDYITVEQKRITINKALPSHW